MLLRWLLYKQINNDVGGEASRVEVDGACCMHPFHGYNIRRIIKIRISRAITVIPQQHKN